MEKSGKNLQRQKIHTTRKAHTLRGIHVYSDDRVHISVNIAHCSFYDIVLYLVCTRRRVTGMVTGGSRQARMK